MSPLTVSAPMPNPGSLPDGYSRHRPEVEAQRVVLHELTAPRDWASRTWAELIEEMLGLGRTDIPLARLAEGHADALRILGQAGRKSERGVLYGVWASRSQHDGVRGVRDADGAITLEGPLAFASGAGLLDRALVPVWLAEDTHVLVDVDLTEVPVDTTTWRTEVMAASRTHQVSLAGRSVGLNDVVGGDNFYLARPGFFAAGVGVAACWVGGAARVADLLHRRHDRPSLAQQMRLGRIRVDLAGAALAVRGTARWLDETDLDQSGLDLTALAAETRSVAADAVRRIVAEARLVTGPAGLALDEALGRAVADLELYAGQHNPDGDAFLLGDPKRRP
jgi:hypothetical protein